MNKNITLSICIATLNRAAVIGETLDSIISQATEEVEIVIVDGSTNDDTNDIVNTYRERFSNIRYFHSVKTGYAQDYCKAIELAQGEFCWLFTDDDTLKQGAIQAVMSEMTQDYGLILVNAEVRNTDLSKSLLDRSLVSKSNRIYKVEDSDQLFADVASYISFIGCVVIRRSLWELRDKESYMDTYFLHVGVIFQALISGGTLVISDSYISIRYGNALWTSKSFYVSLVHWPDLIWSFSNYSESAKQKVCKREPWRSMKTLLIFRARGTYSLNDYNKYISPCSLHSLFKISAWMIAGFPGYLLNFVFFVYVSVFRSFYRTSGLFLVDLQISKFYSRKYFQRLKLSLQKMGGKLFKLRKL
jgi:abequosyltransferase